MLRSDALMCDDAVDVRAVNRELTPLRSRYDSCASSARSSCLSTASSAHSVRSASSQRRRHTTNNNANVVGRYHPPSASITASPYEYDMTATSSESVERSSQTARHAGMMTTSLADSVGVASDVEVSSCRFSGRGSVSRFLAERRRESIDSGLNLDSATYQSESFRRASDPLLNNCGVVADTSQSTTQRCHSSASAPGTWREGHGRVGVGSASSSRGAAPPSLMSSRSSIATNMSDGVDVKYTPPTSGPSVADQVSIISISIIIVINTADSMSYAC